MHACSNSLDTGNSRYRMCYPYCTVTALGNGRDEQTCLDLTVFAQHRATRCMPVIFKADLLTVACAIWAVTVYSALTSLSSGLIWFASLAPKGK